VVKSPVLLSGGTDRAGHQFLPLASELPVRFSVADDDEFHDTVATMLWLFSVAPTRQEVHHGTGGHGADMFKVHPELRV
jgi:hypothetical protein